MNKAVDISQELTLEALYSEFCKFEEETELLDSRYAYIWEGIRLEIFSLLQTQLFHSQRAQDSVKPRNLPLKQKIFTIIALVGNGMQTMMRNHFSLKKRMNFDILFISGGRRKKEADDTFWDIYIDPLLDIVGIHENLLIEEPYRNAHMIPAKTKNIMYSDDNYIWHMIHFLRSIFVNTSEIGLFFKNIESDLNDTFSVTTEIKKLAVRYHELYLFLYGRYWRLLKKIQPKILCVVCGYGKEPIIHAAKDLCIPTVELQHGIISKYHLGYDIGKGRKQGFCDYLFTFGPAWVEMANFPISKDKIIPIGYPYLSTSINKLSSVQKKDQILFISQGTIGDRLSEFAVELLRIKPATVRIVYKLHPGEILRWESTYKSLYQAFQNAELEVVVGDTPSLYQIMAESKWQIGVNSTALFEGMMFLCKTYIVDLPGKEYVQQMIDQGEFSLIPSPHFLDFSYDPDKLKKHRSDFFCDETPERFKNAIKIAMGDRSK